MLARMLTAAIALLCPAARALAQDLGVKAPPQPRPIAIVNAEIHPIASDIIPNGFIKFDRGVITAIGRMTNDDGSTLLDVDGLRADGYDVIDLHNQLGMSVYPGMIASYSQLGLTEIAAVRSTLDYAEVGAMTPELRAVVAVNPDSTLIPVTRSNGVLLAGVFPTTNSGGLISYFSGPGGLLPGRAGVIRLDGWTWEDMTVLDDAGLVINWPQPRPIIAWWMNRSADDQRKDSAAQLQALADFFRSARAYAAARQGGQSNLPVDQRFEAVRKVLARQRPVYVLANDYDQILQAVAFADEHNLRLVLVGGNDAPQCAELLKRHQVSVIVQGTIRFPKRDDSPYDDAYTLPLRLADAGVRFALASGEEASHERNVPYAAALASAYGLDQASAMRAVTLSAAEALGVADRYGSLEPQKSATLFISDGDPLEIATRVSRAFIDGREIDLRNKQTELDRKYREKYRQVDGEKGARGKVGGR